MEFHHRASAQTIHMLHGGGMRRIWSRMGEPGSVFSITNFGGALELVISFI